MAVLQHSWARAFFVLGQGKGESSNCGVQCLRLSLSWNLFFYSASMIPSTCASTFPFNSLLALFSAYSEFLSFFTLFFFCSCDFTLWPLNLVGSLSSARCPLRCVALSICLAQLSMARCCSPPTHLFFSYIAAILLHILQQASKGITRSLPPLL